MKNITQEKWLTFLIHYKLNGLPNYYSCHIIPTERDINAEVLILLKPEERNYHGETIQTYLTGEYVHVTFFPEMLHEIEELNKFLTKLHTLVKDL